MDAFVFHSTRYPRGRVALALAAVMAWMAAPAWAGPSKWKQFGADADQSNYNRGEAALNAANIATLVPVWTAPQWLVPADLPAMQHGIFYGTGHKLGLSAISQTRGTAKWSDPDSTSTCTPALSPDGRVLTYAYRYPGQAFGEGALVGVDADTGAQLWAQRLSGIGTGCTTIAGNMVVVVTSKGWTQSWNWRDGGDEDGSSLTQFTMPIDLHAAAQGRWYYVVATQTRHVYQVDGREKSAKSPRGWDVELGSLTDGTASTGRISGTALLVSDSAGGVYAIDLATGAPRWSIALPSAMDTTPGVTATNDSTAFAVARPVGSDADAIDALDVATGAITWTSPLSQAQRVQSNLALANGMVFAGVGAHTCTTLAVVDAATGAPITALSTGMPDSGSASRCDLAVADGRVVLHARTASGPAMQVLGLPDDRR